MLKGKSVKEIDEMLLKSKNTLARNFKESIIHECGQAKAIYGMKISEIEKLYEELGNIHIENISGIALEDGAEALAEIEILLSRNVEIPNEASIFYNKYMKRK